MKQYSDLINLYKDYFNISALSRISGIKLQTFKDHVNRDSPDIDEGVRNFFLDLRNKINEIERKQNGGKT